jgi:hypothetical protein
MGTQPSITNAILPYSTNIGYPRIVILFVDAVDEYWKMCIIKRRTKNAPLSEQFKTSSLWNIFQYKIILFKIVKLCFGLVNIGWDLGGKKLQLIGVKPFKWRYIEKSENLKIICFVGIL